jgi:hypothetical protein
MPFYPSEVFTAHLQILLLQVGFVSRKINQKKNKASVTRNMMFRKTE